MTDQKYRRSSLIFLILSFVIGGALVIGIGATARSLMTEARYTTIEWWQYALLALVIGLTVILFLKKVRHRLVWEVVFTVTLFLGVWYALLLILPISIALVAASVLTLADIFLRIVAVHDLFYLIGAAGVALDFAGWLPPEAILVVLVVMTIYDMVAGSPGGPVEQLAAELVQRGIIPGLVIPTQWKQLVSDLDHVVKTDAALLGAGDVILPLCLVAKASFVGVLPAVAVLGGLIVGVIVLGRTGDTHPRAALPALATGAILPFLVLRVMGLV